MDKQGMMKSATRVLVLLLLIFALLFILTFTGVMKCSQVPVMGEQWCDVYWFFKTIATGKPKVLIVYGDTGLGNPIDGEGSLRELLANPQITGVQTDTLHVSRVNIGNLRGYDIVIVDRARQIETKQLQAFIEYATGPTGGTLVWTGDAGTQLGPDDQYLHEEERNGTLVEGKKVDEKDLKVIGPWARKIGDLMVPFDELLGVELVNNTSPTYCQLISCKGGQPIYVGNLEPEPSATHPFVKGMGTTLPLYIMPGEDFAVVQTMPGGVVTEVLSLNFGSKYVMVEGKRVDLNKSVPLIVTSGLGERVIYYSMPPEYYANPSLAKAGKPVFLLPVENLYYGIIKGG